MQLKRTAMIGLALMAASGITMAFWTVWFHTRSWIPVNIPISLSQGSHVKTEEFVPNMSGQYVINIEAENKISIETLKCMLGSEFPPNRCHIPPILKVSWVLSSNGETTQGTSDDTVGSGATGPTGDASRMIGLFEAKQGQQYRLDFDVLADGSSLAVTNPRLKVSISDAKYESSLVINGFLRLVCTFLGIVGGALSLTSVLAQRRRSSRL
jgi:hypothetical protein